MTVDPTKGANPTDPARDPDATGSADPTARIRRLVEPGLRAAVDALADPSARRIAGYQLGWLETDGSPAPAGRGGKAVRPTLAVLSAEAAGGSGQDGVPAAVAVELVHNFSLLHDDVMDRDLERRHRPTGWVAFGEGPAILAGNAMLLAAAEVLLAAGPGGRRSLPYLLAATQELIGGQFQDLALENRARVEVGEVLAMEAGKTAALMACAASIGALAVGADAALVDGLARYGHHLGMAFQLVDDVLGVAGDPAVTGKSSSSDVRAGKRSAPIVWALGAGSAASRRLAGMLDAGPPTVEEDVVLAKKLIEEAGGLEWAVREADAEVAAALAELAALPVVAEPAQALVAIARQVVERDH